MKDKKGTKSPKSQGPLSLCPLSNILELMQCDYLGSSNRSLVISSWVSQPSGSSTETNITITAHSDLWTDISFKLNFFVCFWLKGWGQASVTNLCNLTKVTSLHFHEPHSYTTCPNITNHDKSVVYFIWTCLLTQQTVLSASVSCFFLHVICTVPINLNISLVTLNSVWLMDIVSNADFRWGL